MYLFLCQSICSQLCLLLIKKIGSEHLTLPVQQRVKMAWKRLQHCCGFVPTQLGGRMPLKCQAWCVPASPSRGFTGAVPANMFNNAGPFHRDAESNCCVCLPIDILAAHVNSFTCVTSSTGWNHTVMREGGSLLFVSPGTQPLHIHVHHDRKEGGKISTAN